MSSNDERHRQLIFDLLLGQISEDDFRRAYPVGTDLGALGLAMLERALEQRDPEGVELGLHLGHRFGISLPYLEPLLALVNADWHERHEDVVDGLGTLRSPRSVGALHAAALAQHPYLDYDDAYALGTKAIWALGGIANLEAVERLADLARGGNPVLEGAAVEQLERIVHAGHAGHGGRAGATEGVRGAARDRLDALRRDAP